MVIYMSRRPDGSLKILKLTFFEGAESKGLTLLRKYLLVLIEGKSAFVFVHDRPCG